MRRTGRFLSAPAVLRPYSSSSSADDAASLAASPLLVEEHHGKRTVIERRRADDDLSRRPSPSHSPSSPSPSPSSLSPSFPPEEGGDEGAAATATTATTTEVPPSPSSPSPLRLLSRSLRRRAEAALLPRGFPDSVTPDYLEYQLASLPVHVTGWVCSSLATSALLAAATTASLLPSHVASSSSSSAVATVTAAVASSAAVKWVAKDGLGAAGRLLTGSKLGTRIDDDPRRWRLAGEALTTVALALDISSPLVSAGGGVPFLAVAGLGAFVSAAAKGVARPAARVIQAHFASASRLGNVGDVAAKEEVWEVAGQIVGLAAGVAVLDALLLGGGGWVLGGGGGGDGGGGAGAIGGGSLPAAAAAGSATAAATGRAAMVAAAWLAFQGLHVLLRVRSLRALRFDSLNHKRGCLVASAFVARRLLLPKEGAGGGGGGGREGGRKEEGVGCGGGSSSEKFPPPPPSPSRSPPLPTPREAAVLEPMLASPLSMRPRVSIGATVEEAFPPTSPTSSRTPLPPRASAGGAGAGGGGSAAAADGAPRSSSRPPPSPPRPPPPTLRESLAAHGKDARHALSWRDGRGRAVLVRGAEPSDALCILLQCAYLDATGVADASAADLARSWAWARGSFAEFLEQAEEVGWVSGPGMGLLAGAARLGAGGEEEGAGAAGRGGAAGAER